MSDLPDHVLRNRAAWDQWASSYTVAGEENWARNAPEWGVWGVPDSDVGLLPEKLAGLDVIELGCEACHRLPQAFQGPV